ncbi:hypothetical protein V1477_002054 [Vespula maculifrons]|uniref:Uncharacterized protein n=1 Tax=Vespula maculifrons TaxID=7453 RepID=A0ABD2CXW4_VESMC
MPIVMIHDHRMRMCMVMIYVGYIPDNISVPIFACINVVGRKKKKGIKGRKKEEKNKRKKQWKHATYLEKEEEKGKNMVEMVATPLVESGGAPGGSVTSKEGSENGSRMFGLLKNLERSQGIISTCVQIKKNLQIVSMVTEWNHFEEMKEEEEEEQESRGRRPYFSFVLKVLPSTFSIRSHPNKKNNL